MFVRLSVSFSLFLFFLLIPPPPRSTLFPYTTLFRSTMGRDRDVCHLWSGFSGRRADRKKNQADSQGCPPAHIFRSEEHTSELQSRGHLVCRLLLEKKNRKYSNPTSVPTN